MCPSAYDAKHTSLRPTSRVCARLAANTFSFPVPSIMGSPLNVDLLVAKTRLATACPVLKPALVSSLIILGLKTSAFLGLAVQVVISARLSYCVFRLFIFMASSRRFRTFQNLRETKKFVHMGTPRRINSDFGNLRVHIQSL